MKQSPIFVKTYDFTKWLLEHTIKFPKSQRFVMGKRLETVVLDFYDLMIESGKTQDNKLILVKADLTLEKMRLYLRLCQDLQLFSYKQYEYAYREVNEIGCLLGAWIKKG